MVFLGVYKAIYDYAPQSENELEISEGDLLYVLEKSTQDDWWKAKKRAGSEDEDEPEGLVPSNYIEEAKPIHHARALYDYTRQTDEELSFPEDATLAVYDNSDPDWSLVGMNGEYGFAPTNYIEVAEAARPGLPTRGQPHDIMEEEPEDTPTPSSPGSPVQSPAAALAGIIQRKASMPAARPATFTPEDSEEEDPPAPVLPQRPTSQEVPQSTTQYATPRSPDTSGAIASPPYNRVSHRDAEEENGYPSPRGYHLYNIHEMVPVMGKQKKMPTTFGINVAKGTLMIAPEKSRDGPQQEWTADKLTHYSIEGKHVFVELVRPSKSVDFHAGAKDTAEEIVAALGELAGAYRAEGLREVIAAGSSHGGQKKGQILYDFMAQGDDEVTVGVGDEVIVLDDTKSEEWWMVRRLKNGKEGVVPSSYVEVTGTVSPAHTGGLNTGLSVVDQNRREEERMAREAAKSSRDRSGSDARVSEVGPGVRLPKRGSSLMGKDNGNIETAQRSKRESRSDSKSSSNSKPKPDGSKTRTWTDRSGSFKVEAQFIGLKDGKIHLHKLNGVKIAVPVQKMSVEDLEYVERVTGVSLDEDKPLSDVKARSQQASASQPAKAGLQKQPDYDWFDFFLKCGVGPYQCERYTSAFVKDSMDESILPDVTPSVLRTLGLKEGDILKVMKYLDSKYNRTGDARSKRNVSFGGAEFIGNEEDGAANEGAGGLFSGPGGALRNNTRKGRPAPAVQTNDVVDPKAFEQTKDTPTSAKPQPPDATPTPLTSVPAREPKVTNGFDDDAWDVKPSKQPTKTASPPPAAASQPPAPQQPALTGAMQELSLLSPPLQPTPAPQPPPAQVAQPAQQASQNPAAVTPSFFSQISPQQTGPQISRAPQGMQAQAIGIPSLNINQTGYGGQQPQQTMPPRLRPQAPPAQSTGGLMPPPPPRPLSAPQNPSLQNGFGAPPLAPQLTGYQPSGNVATQPAPPGQSLSELNNFRLQQQFGQQQLQPQATGFGQMPGQMSQFGNGPMPQPNGFGQQPQQLQAQPTAFGQAPLQPQTTAFSPQFPGQQSQGPAFQQSQPFLNGQATGSPFANPPVQQFSPTGPSLQPQRTGVNSFLPPALQPQLTAQPSNFGSSAFGQSISPPPIPQQAPMAPLQPQKTGPAPPVRFGVTGEAKKLTPQPTGRRANLAQATPQNPFGF